MGFNQPSSGGPSQDDRLDSWKSIGRYLNKDIRTVQRWEATEGLPVYRHQHSKQGSVYAYKSEIDAWWKNRPRASRQRPTEPDSPQPSFGRRIGTLYPQLGLYAVLIVVLAFSIVKAKQMFVNRAAAPQVNTSQPITIAILPFQNISTTAEENNLAVDLTKELVAGFQHSKGLRVVDQNLLTRLEDGTDSVQHVGQIFHFDKLLRGVASRSGSTIRVRAELIDAVSGDTVWSRQFDRGSPNSPEIENQIAISIVADVENILTTDNRPQP